MAQRSMRAVAWRHRPLFFSGSRSCYLSLSRQQTHVTLSGAHQTRRLSCTRSAADAPRMHSPLDAAADVVSFWFGDGARSPAGEVGVEKMQQWFVKDDTFDAIVRNRYEALYDQLKDDAQQRALLLEAGGRGAVALIVVLDQFPRNMFRNSARMYESDAVTAELAMQIIGRTSGKTNVDMVWSKIPLIQRSFVLLPLEHSEHIEHQKICVEESKKLLDHCQEWMIHEKDAATRGGLEIVEGYLKEHLQYAIQHRDIISRFGRFPHRNNILGRTATPEEEAFLREPGSSF